MPTSRRATILVVDDVEGVHAVIRRQLSAQGHTVLEASDGPAALDIIRQREGVLDLLLADVVMPQMNGTELAGIVSTAYPGLPVVLVSAYAPAGLTRVGLTDALIPVLQKPFDEGRLGEIVDVALDLATKPRRPSRPVASV